MLNLRDFIEGEIVEVNEMVGGMRVGICATDVGEYEVKLNTFIS